MNKIYAIGISGGTGSGKSYVAAKLKRMFPGKVLVISADDYYKPIKELKKISPDINFDRPSSVDHAELARDVINLKKGLPTALNKYDIKHNRVLKSNTTKPLPIIIVEGIMIYSSPALRKALDYRYFIHVDADTRLAYRLVRDTEERGWKLRDAVQYYLDHAKPMHEKYIEPTKKFANRIITLKTNRSTLALDVIAAKIKQTLR